MRYLKTYRVFESSVSGLTKKQEEFLNNYTLGRWKYDPTSGLVDVGGSFDCEHRKLKTLSRVKFGKVSGNFFCRYNKLTSLEGSPQEVGGNFGCYNNDLTSLKGAPQKVGWGFYCYYNNLTSLEGAPREVGGEFVCDAFELGKGQWNPEGWLKILKEGSPKAQKLILTLMSPEVLNKQIKKDPAGTIMKLKPVWNHENFKKIRSKLVWPQGYEEQMDIVGGLNTIGF